MKQTFIKKFGKLVEDAIKSINANCTAASKYGYPRPGCLKLTEPFEGRIVAVINGYAITMTKKNVSFVELREFTKEFGELRGNVLLLHLADEVEKLRVTVQPEIFDPFTMSAGTDGARQELKRLQII